MLLHWLNMMRIVIIILNDEDSDSDMDKHLLLVDSVHREDSVAGPEMFL